MVAGVAEDVWAQVPTHLLLYLDTQADDVAEVSGLGLGFRV